jgi:hypothetical protein
MTVRISTFARTKLADAFGAPSGQGSVGMFDHGVMYIYSGPQPLSANDAVAGTLLGIVTKASGAFSFGAATNGLVFAASAAGVSAKSTDVWSFNGIADGTAGWFRLMGNANDALGGSNTTNARLDGSVGTSGADLNLSNIAVVTGAPNTIDVFSFTIPAQ